MAADFSFIQLVKELSEEGITFANKQFKWDTAADVGEVVNALETQQTVHYLNLEGNTLGVDAAAAIGKALVKHPEFHKALWKNMFTSRLKTEIPEALKLLGNGLSLAGARLTVLDLSDNAIGPNGMVGLEDLLRSPVCYSLQELHMNNCGLGIYGGRMLSKAVIACHQESTAAGTPLQLKVFIAGRNRLENEGAKAIAEMFTILKTLEVIVMPQNSIYHSGIAELAKGFKNNPNLKVLNLNDNTVTSKGAAHIADALSFIPDLQEINLGDCLLRTNGAYHFAEALGENHFKLQEVDLGFNDVGADGGVVLAVALQNKPNLKKLNLNGNQFGVAARERIREIMQDSANPKALEEMDDDESDADEDECDEDDGDDTINEEGEEEEEIYDGHHSDTTDEVEEDDYAENTAEETAYTTTQAFTTKMLSANDSFSSNESAPFDKTSTNTDITAEYFCLSKKPCTLQMFESLPETDKLQAFKNVMKQFSDDNYLLLLIFTALKCGHLSQESTAALNLATSLFKECLDYAVTTNQERRVLNYLLIQLRLMRSELKFESSYNVKACQYAMKETLNKKHIASEYIKNTLNVFLDQLGS